MMSYLLVSATLIDAKQTSDQLNYLHLHQTQTPTLFFLLLVVTFVSSFS